ncbi:MAG TPA: hypothetical protein VMZ50_06460, partial [Phycisphaerae bacterium]|nr:hypothetical protein [Phycisphaerae bacterium]
MHTCKFEVSSPTDGKLHLAPLPRRVAEGLGAALRRTLLRHVEGACVSAVRIEGMAHEFARLDGVREDAVQIVENLRKVRVALHGTARACVSIAAAGPATVTAAELASNGEVTTSSPDRVLATLNEGAQIKMTVEVSRGTGYESAERIQGQRPGWIEIDRDYGPVRRAAMNVEGADDAASLSIEVTTDGAVSPAEVMARAAEMLGSNAEADEPVPSLCRSVADAARSPIQVKRPAVAPPAAQARDLGKCPPTAAVPGLTELQKRSYESLVQQSCDPGGRQAKGLEKLFRDAFGAGLAGGEGLEYLGYELGDAEMGPRDCLRFGRTYAGLLRLHLRAASGGGTRAVEVCRLPLMTDRGTFIIAGREKVVLGRLQADVDSRYNDLTTRRLLLVGHQLESALGEAMAADVEAIARLPSAADLSLHGFAKTVREFFNRGRFVRRAETTNPLALVSHLRRVVQWGKRRRPGYDARGVHANHFGRLCLLETPEGESIGINLNLGVFAGVDEQGRLLTPYRKCDGGAIEHLSPAAERDRTIADLAADDAYGTRYGGGMLAKVGDEIARIDVSDADYLPVHPLQALGASASLIPFVAHDDPNRALMGANMQKQAAALLAPEAPLVRSGMEGRVAADALTDVRAESDGVVVRAAADEIVVESEGGDRRSYPLDGICGSSHGTCLRQRPRVRPGDEVHEGQVLADGPATDGGALALGRNVLVGYLPWEGYNFEDSIVISDRLLRDGAFTSLKVQEFVATVARDAAKGERLGAGHLPAEDTANLSPAGMVTEGASVEGGDVLVAKSVLAEGADGQTQRRDASLRMPAGQCGRVVKIEHFSADRGDPLDDGVAELVRV